MEDVFKTLLLRKSINVSGKYISHLRFAGVIVVFAETLENLNVQDYLYLTNPTKKIQQEASWEEDSVELEFKDSAKLEGKCLEKTLLMGLVYKFKVTQRVMERSMLRRVYDTRGKENNRHSP